MPVQFGNNWIQKIPRTAKLDSTNGLVQFWLSLEFSSSNYFQIGQHVVLLHIQIGSQILWSQSVNYTNQASEKQNKNRGNECQVAI